MSATTHAWLISIVLLCTVLVICCNWTVTYHSLSSSTEHTHDRDTDLHNDDPHTYPFHTSVSIALILYAPMVLDMTVEYCFQSSKQQHSHTSREYGTSGTGKEFSWPLQLFVVCFPNIFIEYDLIQVGLIPLILYFQHTCVILLQEYRIQRLSSFQQMVESKEFHHIFILVIVVCLMACLFSLSTSTDLHIMDSGNGLEAMKGVVIGLTLLYHTIIIGRAIDLIKESLKPTCIIRYVESARVLFIANLVLLMTAACVPFIDLIFYHHPRILFAIDLPDNIYLEVLLILSTTTTFLIRNYENRLIITSYKNDLQSTKKLTRSIAHEIRTPLNTAFMALELLKDNMQYPPEQPPTKPPVDPRTDWLDTIQNIREACDVALGILNQLLTFDKLSSKMLQLERKFVPILKVIEANTKLFRVQALQCGLHFQVDVPSEDKLLMHELYLHIDEEKLNQVIRNLLSNAMKFTPKRGSVMVRVAFDQTIPTTTNNYSPTSWWTVLQCVYTRMMNTIKGYLFTVWMSFCQCLRISSMTGSSTTTPLPTSLQSSKPFGNDNNKVVGTIRISVIDSGSGIDEEDQAKLFQEYVQINPGELQKGQGSGLGLSISKSIITMHGGTIGVSSRGANMGSTFFIELPAYCHVATTNENTLVSTTRRSVSYSMMSNGEHGLMNLTSSALTSVSQPTEHQYPLSTPLSPMTGMSPRVLRDASFAKIVPIATSTRVHHPSGIIGVGTGVGSNEDEPSTTKVIHLQEQIVDPLEISEDIDGEEETTTPHHGSRDSHDHSHGHTQSQGSNDSNTKQGHIHHGQSHSHNHNRYSLQKCYNILIVDDSDANRKMLGKLLQRDGHNVIEAKDGTEAVAMIRPFYPEPPQVVDLEAGVPLIEPSLSSSSPMSSDRTSSPIDFILMDNFMIDMNGPEATRAIRNLGYRRPILGVTGSMDDDVDRLLQAGANCVLQKPIDMKSVYKALKAMGFFKDQHHSQKV